MGRVYLDEDDLTPLQADMLESGELQRVEDDGKDSEEVEDDEQEDEVFGPPVATPSPAVSKQNSYQVLSSILDTERLSTIQKELIASLDLDPEAITLEEMRNIAVRYGLPESQRKLASIAATQNPHDVDPFLAALSQRPYEPSAEEIAAYKKKHGLD